MRIYILLVFLFLINVSQAQLSLFDINIHGYAVETRHMNAEISALIIDFEDARLDDSFGLLPVYIHRFAIPSAQAVIHARITNESVGLLAHPDMLQVADIERIRSDFQLVSSLIFLEGKPYAEVMILPLRNASEGQLELLEACLLEVEVDPVSSPKAMKDLFADNSVLANGAWYRIATEETGMYQITYDDLLGMGINPASIDPRKIRIFGNGNGMVPEKNSDDRPDDLVENPILVIGEEDGVFNEDDYIVFYGQSPVKWNYIPFQGYGLFQHQINYYADKTYYFLNIEQHPGKRVLDVSVQGIIPTVIVDEFSDYAVHENDEVNILKTGRQWYGERFSDQTVYEYTFNFPNIKEDYLVSLRTNIAATSTIESNFDYYYGNEHILKAPVSKIILGTTVYAWTSTPDTVSFYPNGDEITIRVEYDKPTTTSIGWMNYVAVNARRKMIFEGPFMAFRDHLSVNDSAVAEFRISAANEHLRVWNVTSPFSISSQPGQLSGSMYTFRAPAHEIRQYIAFDGSGYNSIEFIEQIQNQNLHAYYIVLTHPDFMTQAQRMLAIHRAHDNMSGFIVTPQEIYNEFSSGKQDPGAIRDFIRMLYLKGDSLSRPRYLLLLGDASYDYKDRVPMNTNFVPTYQSLEALKLGYSFVTDDFFGLLDPGDGVNAYGKSVEIGIGRFPVHTVEQADQMVNKVESYLSMEPDVLGNWRNDIFFVADDEDQNLHFTQAEKLQYVIDTGYHVYNRPKIYLDAFPQISTPTGSRYPEVNDAIDRMMEKGSLIVNYTGHGGERGWSHEGVLDIQMINSWTNWNRLPLFITATCEFSRFDDPSMISAGEYVFLNPLGGGVGLLTTSRLAWADPNFRLNRAVYQFMFRRINGEFYKIGDVVRLAKTDQNNGTNIKNFVLLGDPAMQLAYPECNVKTLTVNGIDVDFPDDTITAMSEVFITGFISDYNGDTLTDFNGFVFPTVFDKLLTMSTLGNDAGSFPANFELQGQNLYEGKATVKNGFFSFSFFMTQNMASNYGLGKISYYAYDTVDMRDAHGYYKVKTGGINQNVIPDNEGPELSLYINNTNFVSGGLTNNEPVFLAYLKDEHGINFIGNGIGRDITLTLDHDIQTTVILNTYFDPDVDSYQSGWVSFPYTDLSDGTHTLTLEAWDNMNNVSRKDIKFQVSVNSQVTLNGVLNYPNPFTDLTYFVFNHNKPDNFFDVEVRIFNINGQLVRSLRQSTPSVGMSVSPIAWDGTDSGGNKLGSGIYVYRLYVTDEQGTQFVQTSKLIFTGKKQ